MYFQVGALFSLERAKILVRGGDRTLAWPGPTKVTNISSLGGPIRLLSKQKLLVTSRSIDSH